MSNNTQVTPELLRQSKYEGFIRHASAVHDEKTTEQMFNSYVQKDAAREQKVVDLHKNILEGLK